MSFIDIAVADLRLDGENPRHDPTKGEQKIVAALMAAFGPKITELAEDIATNGLSPIDPPMVIKDGTAYIVVEGNRRLAAVRLLGNPSLASTPADVKAFTALAKKMAAPVKVISCYVAPNRAAARHWQELRHRGQAGGRGVVPWDPEAINRFFGATSATTTKAILLSDAIKVAYPLNKTLLADLDAVMKTNSSTLGRLVSDPKFREGLGIVLKPTFGSHYSSADLEPALMRVLADLTGPSKMKVADFYYQDQRVAYLKALAAILPNPAKRQAHASPLLPVTTTPPPLPAPVPTTPLSAVAGSVAGTPTAAAPVVPAPASKPTPTPAGTRHLFEGVRLPKFSVRVRNVLGEIQRLPVDEFANASAVLMRVVINLAIIEVFEKNTWSLKHPAKAPGKQPQDKTLAELVRA